MIVDGDRVFRSFRVIKDWLAVADFGQPDRSQGGIILEDGGDDSLRYHNEQVRYGEVIATGNGLVMGGKVVCFDLPKVGEVVMFSRKVGMKVSFQYVHPIWGPVYIRILSPDQVEAAIEDFEPWWNPSECQIAPGLDYNS